MVGAARAGEDGEASPLALLALIIPVAGYFAMNSGGGGGGGDDEDDDDEVRCQKCALPKTKKKNKKKRKCCSPSCTKILLHSHSHSPLNKHSVPPP
jgi:hypothetical protein